MVIGWPLMTVRLKDFMIKLSFITVVICHKNVFIEFMATKQTFYSRESINSDYIGTFP